MLEVGGRMPEALPPKAGRGQMHRTIHLPSSFSLSIVETDRLFSHAVQ